MLAAGAVGQDGDLAAAEEELRDGVVQSCLVQRLIDAAAGELIRELGQPAALTRSGCLPAAGAIETSAQFIESTQLLTSN